MSIPSVGAGVATVLPMLPERGEKPAPVVDNDASEKATKAAPVSGTGQFVDKTV